MARYIFRRKIACFIIPIVFLMVLCVYSMMENPFHRQKLKSPDLPVLNRVMNSNSTSTVSHHNKSISVRTRLETDAIKRLTAGPLRKVSPTDSPNLRKVKLLCWIMTSPQTLYKKALHINETWGPRCDVTLYMSSQADPKFPAVGLPVAEGRLNLWEKTRTAFDYIYQNHFNDADWFMKADDDTYVIVENLRYFLGDKNSSERVYYGHHTHFGEYSKEGYMSGGAGYVLSKEALRLFVTKGLKGSKDCERSKINEDVLVGKCLMAVDVHPGDSRDSQKRARFLLYPLIKFVNGYLPDWYSKFVTYDVERGPGCCSDYLISCHYVTPEDMHLLDFCVYHLRLAHNDGRHVYRIGNKDVPV